MKGRGGAAVACYQQTRVFDAIDHWHESAGCHGFAGCSSSEHDVYDGCTDLTSSEQPEEVFKHGTDGTPGIDGSWGSEGKDGEDGKAAEDAPDGEPGQPGEDAVTIQIIY